VRSSCLNGAFFDQNGMNVGRQNALDVTVSNFLDRSKNFAPIQRIILLSQEISSIALHYDLLILFV